MAKYDSNKHHRRSIRLKNYDYASAGVYFVTICVQHRQLLFGEIINQAMRLNDAGQMVQNVWELLPERFGHIEMDEFVVMPNHFHGILVIDQTRQSVGVSLVDTPVVDTPTRSTTRVAPTDMEPVDELSSPTLGDMVGAFKSITTHQYIQGVRQKNWAAFDRRLWQRNYWEHIIRNEASLTRLREYIQSNSNRWEQDSLHPNANPKKD